MRIKADNNPKELYKRYKKLYPQQAKKIKLLDFCKILEQSEEIEREFVLEDGLFKLPYRMGVIEIIKFKPPAKYRGQSTLHYQETRRLKTPVMNFNDHSDGYIYRVRLNKATSNLHDKDMWYFKTNRKLARTLTTIIREKINDYPERHKNIKYIKET